MRKCSETSNYLTQAKVIRSMGLFHESHKVYKDVYPNDMMVKKKASEAPIIILEECYVETMKSLGMSGTAYENSAGHCFVDKLTYKLGRKHLIIQNYPEAQLCFKKVIKIRMSIYPSS